MSRLNIFKKGWIDMVFEGRNKSYGAYELRKKNPRTTLIALATSFAVTNPIRYLLFVWFW